MVGSVVVAQDRFDRAEVGGCSKWDAVTEDGRGSGRSVRGLGHKGGYLVAAKGAQERMFVVDNLSSLSEGAELGKLGGQSGEGGMVFNGVGGVAFVEAVLQVGVQVCEELLGKGAWPGGNCCRGGRVQRGNLLWYCVSE